MTLSNEKTFEHMKVFWLLRIFSSFVYSPNYKSNQLPLILGELGLFRSVLSGDDLWSDDHQFRTETRESPVERGVGDGLPCSNWEGKSSIEIMQKAIEREWLTWNGWVARIGCIRAIGFGTGEGFLEGIIITVYYSTQQCILHTTNYPLK